MHRSIRTWLTAFFGAVLIGLATSTASANPKYAAYVVHEATGDILYDRYAAEERYPASLTKMMTLYLLFEAMAADELEIDDKMAVSARAAIQPASRLGLTKGSTIDVESAIGALVVVSANDVATVVAERLAGTEQKFAREMTDKARALGMKNTTFHNASGLPDARQVTTARDMSILARALSRDFPQYFGYFDSSSFTWKGKVYGSHNRVARTLDGADGLKTGYTRSSGYNLVTTIGRGDHRLIGVVLGGRSVASRDAHMKEILELAYGDIARNPELIQWVKAPRPSLRPDREEAQALVLAAAAQAATQIAAAEPASADVPAPVLASLSGVPEAPHVSVIDGRPVPRLKPAARIDVASIAPLAPTRAPIVAEPAIAETLNFAALQTTLETIAEADADAGGAPIGEGDAELAEPRIWAIQVGAYREQRQAVARIQNVQTDVRAIAARAVKEVNIAERSSRDVYRARFTGLTEREAATSCDALLRGGKGECITIADPQAR